MRTWKRLSEELKKSFESQHVTSENQVNMALVACLRLSMRRAAQGDIRRVFELSNDPLVRSNSIHDREISWQEHQGWYANALLDPELRFYIFENGAGKQLAGQVRLAQKQDLWHISISICREFRGKGLGGHMLQAAMQDCGGKLFRAEILGDNTASIRMFKRLGFRETGMQTYGTREFGIWEYER